MPKIQKLFIMNQEARAEDRGKKKKEKRKKPS